MTNARVAGSCVIAPLAQHRELLISTSPVQINCPRVEHHTAIWRVHDETAVKIVDMSQLTTPSTPIRGRWQILPSTSAKWRDSEFRGSCGSFVTHETEEFRDSVDLPFALG
jgi:hypothetical protein